MDRRLGVPQAPCFITGGGEGGRALASLSAPGLRVPKKLRTKPMSQLSADTQTSFIFIKKPYSTINPQHFIFNNSTEKQNLLIVHWKEKKLQNLFFFKPIEKNHTYAICIHAMFMYIACILMSYFLTTSGKIYILTTLKENSNLRPMQGSISSSTEIQRKTKVN